MPPGTFGAPLAIQVPGLLDEATASLRRALEEVPPELRDGIVVEPGSASDVICAVARAYDPDVVIIGAHRYGVLERVLGTTAARVVNRIDRPVYVVRPPGTGIAASTGAAPGPDDTSLDAEVGVEHRELRLADLPAASATLRREHAALEQTYLALLAAYREGDWSDVRTQWDKFDAALRAHMDLEDEHLLPVFREIAPKEADALRSEHDELRRMLGELGVGIELHAVSHDSVAALIGRVRAHAIREELLFYPWIDWELDMHDVPAAEKGESHDLVQAHPRSH
jgi:hypothetical protein